MGVTAVLRPGLCLSNRLYTFPGLPSFARNLGYLHEIDDEARWCASHADWIKSKRLDNFSGLPRFARNDGIPSFSGLLRLVLAMTELRHQFRGVGASC